MIIKRSTEALNWNYKKILIKFLEKRNSEIKKRESKQAENTVKW